MAGAARPLNTANPGGAAPVEGAAAGDLDAALDQAAGRVDGRADSQRGAPPAAASANAAARFHPQTVQNLAARIAARAADGGRVFDIRLDPAELGRVDVRLELGADNSVRALLSAERAETLAELQRSARELEKALAEAGLDLEEGGLSFSLSHQGDDDGAEHVAPDFKADAFAAANAAGAIESGPARGPARLYGFELAARSGLDMRI